MSIFSDIVAAGKKIEDVLTDIVTFGNKLKAVYQALSGPTLAAASAVFYDVMKTAISAEAVATDVQTGNIGGAFTLSATTLGLVKQVVADVKAGEGQIVTDLKALGIIK